MITKAFYANSTTGQRAQIIISGTLVTRAKFDRRGTRTQVTHHEIEDVQNRRGLANAWHHILVAEGFHTIERR